MREDRTVVVNKGDAASPVAWVIGIAIVVAAVLFILFYWHPWNTSSTTNSTTTITQPGTNGGSTQKSNSTSNSYSQP